MDCQLIAIVEMVEAVAFSDCRLEFVPGPQGPQGVPGPQTSVGQVDGGNAASVYGGTFLINGGNASTVF